VWDKHDSDHVSVPLTLFTKQNLFDSTKLNPNMCMELNPHYIKSMVCNSNYIVTVVLNDSHTYSTGTIVTISGASQGTYNGKYEIIDVINSTSFTYKIKGNGIPVNATPQSGLDLLCQCEQWYKFEVADIEWQQKSSYNSSYIGFAINEISGNGSSITISTSNVNKFKVGDTITISNTDNYNGTFIIDTITKSFNFRNISKYY
jgi:hypothetical protein